MNSGDDVSATSSSVSSFGKFFNQLASPTRKPPIPGGSDDIHQVFNYFDENRGGKISPKELKVGGEESQLSEMVVRLSDADGDGVLGLDDFTKMMKEGEDGELREAVNTFYERENASPSSQMQFIKHLLCIGRKWEAESQCFRQSIQQKIDRRIRHSDMQKRDGE
ncbi:hypothetical protein LXL04_014658 [Taraxacum kok-saghyz]